MPKISNAFLKNYADISDQNPWFSMQDCCQHLNVKPTTVVNWKNKFKNEIWKAGYNKTEDKEPLAQENIDLFMSVTFKRGVISNTLLNDIINYSTENPKESLESCCKHFHYNYTSFAKWYLNFKNGEWKAGYQNTADGEPISQETIDKFLNCFVYSIKINKILFKLVKASSLKDRRNLIIQKRCLKNIVEKYPNLDFWLAVNLGPQLSHINSYIKYQKSTIDQKYIEFTTNNDNYSKFEYKHEPKEEKVPRIKKKKKLWDIY